MYQQASNCLTSSVIIYVHVVIGSLSKVSTKNGVFFNDTTSLLKQAQRELITIYHKATFDSSFVDARTVNGDGL